MRHLFFAMRPKQWVKNFFVLIPLVFGQKLFSSPENLQAALAFVFFCAVSSSIYLFNDLADYERDREHPAKRLRPLAAGKISRSSAAGVGAFLAVFSLVLSFIFIPSAAPILLAYVAFSFVYTSVLKNIVLIDVFSIGVFFLLRILAGCAAAQVDLSHWLLLLTMLLAVFLGFGKRRQEIRLLGRRASAHRGVLARYNRYFIDQAIVILTSSIAVAYTLYTVDDRTVKEFHTYHLLWTVPFVYYGIFRYIFLIQKSYKDGDPTRLFLSDRPMQVNALLWLLTAGAVIYLGV